MRPSVGIAHVSELVLVLESGWPCDPSSPAGRRHGVDSGTSSSTEKHPALQPQATLWGLKGHSHRLVFTSELWACVPASEPGAVSCRSSPDRTGLPQPGRSLACPCRGQFTALRGIWSLPPRTAPRLTLLQRLRDACSSAGAWLVGSPDGLQFEMHST